MSLWVRYWSIVCNYWPSGTVTLIFLADVVTETLSSFWLVWYFSKISWPVWFLFSALLVFTVTHVTTYCFSNSKDCYILLISFFPESDFSTSLNQFSQTLQHDALYSEMCAMGCSCMPPKNLRGKNPIFANLQIHSRHFEPTIPLCEGNLEILKLSVARLGHVIKCGGGPGPVPPPMADIDISLGAWSGAGKCLNWYNFGCMTACDLVWF